MRLTSAESGTFWVVEAANGLPPVCHARIDIEFDELTVETGADLAAVAGRSAGDAIRHRLQQGRRCFLLLVDGQIAAYGWVTVGPEHVGELEREFNLQDDDAYVWDCVTLPGRRRQRLYSALLSRIIRQLHAEGVPRIWIGASRENRPSIRGIENAGFEHVLDLTHRRLYRLTAIWFRPSAVVGADTLHAAYAIIVQEYERRFGRLALGWHPGETYP